MGSLGNLIAFIGAPGAIGGLVRGAVAVEGELDKLHALGVGATTTLNLPDPLQRRFRGKGDHGKKRFRVIGIAVLRESDAP